MVVTAKFIKERTIYPICRGLWCFFKSLFSACVYDSLHYLFFFAKLPLFISVHAEVKPIFYYLLGN